MFFKTICLSAALALVSLTAAAQVVDFDKEHGVLSFERGTGDVLCGAESALSISEEHSKLGTKSLQWEWTEEGAVIEFTGPVPYLKENPNPKETSVSTFVFWVYSVEPMEGTLNFRFYKGDKECCGFDYGMQFTGWRGAWVAFDRDMEGTPEEGMDRLVITAPEGVKTGKLYFDGVILSSFQDVRHHTPDWQAPFINKETTNHWLVLNNSWNLTLDIPYDANAQAESEQDMQKIRDRFIELVTVGKKPWSFEKVKQVYDTYNIRYNSDGTITGKPIYFTRYGETFINLGIPDASKQFSKNGQLLRSANDNLFNFALAWLRETDPQRKDAIAGMYVNLTEHLLDQGFAAGSGQGTLHHLGYSMRNFYTAPVIMKDVLKEAGLMHEVQQAMEWFSGVGEVKIAPEAPGMDIDAFNTSLMGRMASILMLQDGPYKEAYMKAISRWVDNGFKYTSGTKPAFKPDGSVVHHRKSYPAYATGGFDGAVNAVWMLSGTAYAISEESHAILKNALMEMRFYCNTIAFPLALSGRHPDGKGALIPAQYALLADAGSPDGSQAIDQDLASAYLRFNGTKGRWGKKFADAGLKAEKAPEGCHVYGYNCSMSHRRDNWLVTFAGHSRYLWASEIYQGANLYGRYLTHGSMQILSKPDDFVTPAGSGFQVDGWDWCHIPGTTAAEIPMEDMLANVLNVDEFSGYEEMLLSDEWFAGGVSHKGMDGCYAMILHEHDKYNGSLRGKKSFFAFDNRIVALGSNLENALPGSRLHTTLFQETVAEDYVNESGDVIKDSRGNAWIVRNGKANVRVGIQHSYHEETMAPTQARFATAYIDHGDIVKDGSYEYLTLIGTDDEEIAVYQAELPYTVLRCDADVHAVRDELSGITAIAAFGGLREGDGTVLEASPSLIMYSIDGQTLTLSVCNPDLALYSGPSDEKFDAEGKRIERSVYGRDWIENDCGEVEVRIVIKGNWNVSSPNGSSVVAKAVDGSTELVFSTSEGRTEEIVLTQIL